MPRGIAETFQSFRYSPGTGLWHWTENPGLTVDLEDRANATGFFTSGSFLYQSRDSSLVGRFSQILGSQLDIGTVGSVFLTNAIRTRDLQRFARADATYSGLVTTSVLNPVTGQSTTFESVIPLTPKGKAVYVKQGEPVGPNSFVKFQLTEGRTVEATPVVGDYRLASGEEIAQRGAIGYLVRNASDLLNRIAVQMEDAGLIGAGTSLYEVIRQIVSGITVTPAITYWGDAAARRL